MDLVGARSRSRRYEGGGCEDATKHAQRFCKARAQL
jgi:hypothetical protein